MRMVLTPQEQSLLGEARKWAMEHWNPHSDAWETARQFPREAYAQAAADGYLGLASSKQYGGRDLDALSCALVYDCLLYTSFNAFSAFFADSAHRLRPRQASPHL